MSAPVLRLNLNVSSSAVECCSSAVFEFECQLQYCVWIWMLLQCCVWIECQLQCCIWIECQLQCCVWIWMSALVLCLNLNVAPMLCLNLNVASGLDAWTTSNQDVDTPLFLGSGRIHYHHRGNKYRVAGRGSYRDRSLGLGGDRGRDTHHHCSIRHRWKVFLDISKLHWKEDYPDLRMVLRTFSSFLCTLQIIWCLIWSYICTLLSLVDVLRKSRRVIHCKCVF